MLPTTTRSPSLSASAVGAENQEYADKYNKETKPTITTIGGLVTVDAVAEGAGDHSVESDLDISVPRKVQSPSIRAAGM